MRESSWQLGSFESSEDEDKGKDEKGGSRPLRRDPPRILNMSQVHEGQINLRPVEAKTLHAPLFEGLVQNKQEIDNTSTPEKAETAFGEEEKDEEDDEEDADVPADGKHRATIAWQRSAPLPPVETQETPQHPAEFDEVMQQLGSEYAEAASGSQPESPVSGEIPAGFKAGEDESALLSHDDEPITTPAAAGVGGAPPAGPPPELGGSFSSPPEPEPAPRTTSYAYNAAPPPPGWVMNTAPNTAPAAPAATGAFEQQPSTPDQNEYRRGLRRGLVAGFITGYALKAFLASRKLKRVEKATKEQFAVANERMANLQSQHDQLQQRTTSQTEQYQREQREQQDRLERFKANQPAPQRFETAPAAPAVAPLPAIETGTQQKLPPIEALPPIQAQSEEQWVDEHGNEIPLMPGQRLERRGWYSVVVDEHGREVPGAIHYGEAFQREQKREQLSDSAFTGGNDGTDNKPAAVGGGSFTALPGFGVSSVPPPLNAPMIASGQADPAHSLPAGQPTTVDPQHRLKEPRNPVVATVTSPWLWVAVAVLLIAYFTAALV